MYGGEQSDIFDVDLAKHKYIEDNLVCQATTIEDLVISFPQFLKSLLSPCMEMSTICMMMRHKEPHKGPNKWSFYGLWP